MEGVSVVVCCYNSERRIEKVLDYLIRQEVEDFVKWEVVVVDNASTDNTSELAQSFWSRKDTPLRVVFEPEPGLSNARNRGFKEANYSIVSFIDDDNWVENQWVQKVFKWFSNNENLGLLGAHGEAALEGERPFWFDKVQRSYAVGPQAPDTGLQLKALYGAGLSVRKKVWNDLIFNGFQFILSGRKGKSLTSGEDSELCLAVILAGYDLYYDANLRFFHYMPKERLSWGYLIKLTRAFGRADPVINIYQSSVNSYNGYDKNKRENGWIVTLYSIYLFIRSCPGYLKISFSEKEGRPEHIIFNRTKYRMLESIRLIPDFPRLVSGVKNGKWRRVVKN